MENKIMLNGYKAFYKDKTLDIYATSSYEAQKDAAIKFKAKKSYEVTIVLCEKSGEVITHIPDF
jgi:ABC-type thiamine transport system substrate-binding protein